eukprot:4521568-Amphidinium_carterae.2
MTTGHVDEWQPMSSVCRQTASQRSASASWASASGNMPSEDSNSSVARASWNVSRGTLILRGVADQNPHKNDAPGSLAYRTTPRAPRGGRSQGLQVLGLYTGCTRRSTLASTADPASWSPSAMHGNWLHCTLSCSGQNSIRHTALGDSWSWDNLNFQKDAPLGIHCQNILPKAVSEH